MRVALMLALVVAVGCDTPQAAQDDIACTTICRCLVTLPAQQEACVTDCIGNLGPISDDCASCVGEHANSCSTLIDDCQGSCSMPVPVPAQPGE